MEIELNLIISILKLTSNGPISSNLISKEANLPSSVTNKLLQRLKNEGLISVKGSFVDATASQRANMGVYAVQQGANPLTVSTVLSWQEFESISATAFEKNGYRVIKNLRFKQGGRKWEVDVVGIREPLLVCADCKHWRRGLSSSALQRITVAQVARGKALLYTSSVLFGELKCSRQERITLVPVVVSLVANKSKFYAGTPIVSVFQLHDFLDHLPMHLDSLLCLSTDTMRKTGKRKLNGNRHLQRKCQKTF